MEYQMNSSSCFNNDDAYTCEWWKKMIKINEEEEELLTNGMRKGPWTEEEDTKLTSAIAMHGVGRWNTLANLAGLKRSGKSCRLRWLNYLHPDLRRGPFTLNEQLLIIQLQLHWGNRWSKIAESLSGRTDNEVKNYWRTKVQKLARQFNCHVNSPEFRDALRQIWIPRLIEQIRAGANPSSDTTKNQSDGPNYQYRLGLMGSSSSSTSSEACCLLDAHTSWAQNSLNSLAQHKVGPVDPCSKPSSNSGASPLPNTAKAQIDGLDYPYGLGLIGSSSSISSSSTSSETSCLFDTHSSWAQNSLDQHVVGPTDLCSQPSTFTDSCMAHISAESGSFAELDPIWAQINNYWDMTPIDGMICCSLNNN